jgi:hypothetical protein
VFERSGLTMGPKMSPEELQTELERIQKNLQETNLALQKRVREQKTSAKRCNLADKLLPVLRSLWLLGSADHHEVRIYFEQKLPDQSIETRQHLCASLEAWSHTLNRDEQLLYTKPEPTSSSAWHVRMAYNFLEQYALFSWAEKMNIAHGLTPSSRCLHKYATEHRSKEALRYLDYVPTKTRRGINQWLQRWKNRWNVTRGTISRRENVSDADAILKETMKK